MHMYKREDFSEAGNFVECQSVEVDYKSCTVNHNGQRGFVMSIDPYDREITGGKHWIINPEEPVTLKFPTGAVVKLLNKVYIDVENSDNLTLFVDHHSAYSKIGLRYFHFTIRNILDSLYSASAVYQIVIDKDPDNTQLNQDNNWMIKVNGNELTAEEVAFSDHPNLNFKRYSELHFGEVIENDQYIGPKHKLGIWVWEVPILNGI